MSRLPVDSTFNISSSQELQSIASVDSYSSVLRLDPLPLISGMVADLERSHRLTEEECETPKICFKIDQNGRKTTEHDENHKPVCPPTQFLSLSLSSLVCFEYFMYRK